MWYADAKDKKYKLDTRQHVHAAIAYFGANYRKYPKAERQHIAREIRLAAHDYGIEIHSRKFGK